MTVTQKTHSVFACLDNKHEVPVGEPGYSVAAEERGKRVIVARDQLCLLAGHDFAWFSCVQSVTFFIDMPEEVSHSWYQGQSQKGFPGTIVPIYDMLQSWHLVSIKSIPVLH